MEYGNMNQQEQKFKDTTTGNHGLKGLGARVQAQDALEVVGAP